MLQCNVSYRSGAYNMTTVSKNGPKRFNETVEPMQRCKHRPEQTGGAAQVESGIGWFVSVNVSTEFTPEYIWATTNKISLVLINKRAHLNPFFSISHQILVTNYVRVTYLSGAEVATTLHQKTDNYLKGTPQALLVLFIISNSTVL